LRPAGPAPERYQQLADAVDAHCAAYDLFSHSDQPDDRHDNLTQLAPLVNCTLGGAACRPTISVGDAGNRTCVPLSSGTDQTMGSHGDRKSGGTQDVRD
jgi:hypothetical protein